MVFRKVVNFVKNTRSVYTGSTLISRSAIFIPVCTLTKTEMSNIWTALPNNSQPVDVLSKYVLDSNQPLNEYAAPWLNPGTYPTDITELTNYELFTNYMNYLRGFDYSGSITTADNLGLINDIGEGLYSNIGLTPGVVYYDGSAASALVGGYGSGFAIHTPNQYANQVGCVIMFMSSDYKFGIMRIYSTKNNGSLQFFDDATSAYIYTWLNNLPDVPPASTDPYDPIGDSEPSGQGDGTFDFTSTDIPIPGLPNIGAMNTGFLNLYHPSAAQLRSLASYMWSGSFDPDNFRKLFADPMDAILGLHIIPTISGHPATSSSSLYVGNVDTGLSMPAVTEQYYSLDCGSVQIPPKWGAYLDYSPYSKLSLYLPYIGVVPISADDCMRGSIRVQYSVDVLSGTCVAFVYCVSNRGADGHTLYTFTGSCNCECPVTEGQYANALMAGMRVVSGIVSGSGGGVAGMVAGGISEAANAAISMVKPDIGRSGGLGGSAGLMGIQYPYLILTVPRMAKPADQNKYIGYPSFVTLTMGDCVGFTRIEVTHLEGIPATQGELEEIVGLLAEGVIF